MRISREVSRSCGAFPVDLRLDAGEQRAYDTAATYRVQFDRIAGDFDAVLTLSAPGEAPEGRVQGDNSLNRDLTLLHVPCINITAGLGLNRMPIGLTLTGPRYRDRLPHRHDLRRILERVLILRIG